MSEQYRRCGECGNLLLVSNFRRDPRNKSGHTNMCKVCARSDASNRKARGRAAKRRGEDPGVRNGLRANMRGAVITDGRCKCGKVTRLYDGLCQACRQRGERRYRELAR